MDACAFKSHTLDYFQVWRSRCFGASTVRVVTCCLAVASWDNLKKTFLHTRSQLLFIVETLLTDLGAPSYPGAQPNSGVHEPNGEGVCRAAPCARQHAKFLQVGRRHSLTSSYKANPTQVPVKQRNI